MTERYLHSKEIPPGLQDISDFKFSRQAAVLAVTQLLPVHPNVEGIVDRFKVQENPGKIKYLNIKHAHEMHAALLSMKSFWWRNTFCPPSPMGHQTRVYSIQ